MSYLASVSDEFVGERLGGIKDVRKELPRIFKFDRRTSGPGGQFREAHDLYWKEQFAMAFAGAIFAGKSPVEARGVAQRKLSYRAPIQKPDGPDDRTLQQHLTDFFKMFSCAERMPSANIRRAAEATWQWKRFFIAWFFAYPQVFAEYREQYQSFPRTLPDSKLPGEMDVLVHRAMVHLSELKTSRQVAPNKKQRA
jgi:hypothetical protein